LKKQFSIIFLLILAKEWQQQLHQDHRNHLVKKIVSSILNTIQQDSHSLSPERLAAITNYAQKTEADMYNTATSHEDYFQRLAERIYRIRKDYDEKQMLKKQQILTTTLSSIDKSAGEQGPPNRIAPQSEYSTSFSTTQIKSEPISNHHHSNLTTTTLSTVPFDKHRISTDGMSRLAIHNNNSTTHTGKNGNLVDTKLIKTEEISSNHETNIQVREVASYQKEPIP
jgi:hypothetical protein